MRHSVVLLPGTILCGKCGRAMRHENEPFKIGKPVHLVCWNTECEQLDVRVVFPMQSIEVEKAEV